MAKKEKNVRDFDSFDETGKKIKLTLTRPDRSLIEEGDLMYKIAFSKAFRGGALTNAEAEEEIRKRGYWNDKKEEKIRELRKELRQLEIKLHTVKDQVDKAKKVADKIAEVRADIDRTMAPRNELVNSTAESYADDVRLHFYVANCVMDPETDEKYFGDYDEYKTRSSERAARDAYLQMVLFMNDLSSSFVQDRPENAWRITKGLMDKDGYFLNDKGQKVDSQGRLINDNFRFIDDSGKFVDEFKYPVDDNGNIDWERYKVEEKSAE